MHLSAVCVATIAEEAKCKKLLLTHVYPEYESFDLQKMVKEKYCCDVRRANDLETYDI